jgi:hypothetical protein
MKRSNLTIALYLLLVFVCGVTVGGFGYRLYSGTPVSAKAPVKLTPEEWRKQYLAEMQTRLKLTPAQFTQINSVLDETRELYKDSRQKHETEMKAIKEQQTGKVRALLTEEQRPEYEKIRAEREAARNKEKKQ